MKTTKRALNLVILLIVIGLGSEILAATGWKNIEWKPAVNTIDGTIDLKEAGINVKDIIGFDIKKDGKREKVFYYLEKDKLNFNSELKLNSKYEMKVITENDRYNIKFKSSDLPNITTTNKEIIVRVPAMPEKGFNWDYYLKIPSNQLKEEFGNSTSKRYLLVDTTNGGPQNMKGTEDWVKQNIAEGSLNGNLAKHLFTPLLMPVIPRTNIRYNSDEGVNQIYEHALDRDTIMLEELVKKNPEIAKKYAELGFDVKDFYGLDKQVLAMIDHAIEYLNKYEHKMEKDKVIFNGFSASAEFANRMTFLHPNRVKIMISGGAIDGAVMPVSNHKGQELIYPIGASDYKKITGRELNIAEQNKVARLYYQGSADDNDPLMAVDTYSDRERNILINLWGKGPLTRRFNVIKSYKETGGKGLFVHEQGIGHTTTSDTFEYIREFIILNRNSETPVYKLPTSKSFKSDLIK